MKPPVPPPFVVQHRAWDCAWVLWSDFQDELSLRRKVSVLVVVHMHPERIGWPECRSMFRLYRAVAGVRV